MEALATGEGWFADERVILELPHDGTKPDSEPHAEHRKLVTAVQLFPKSVVCLLSALPLHGLADRYPSKVWLAVQRRIAPTDAALDAGVELISMPAWSVSDVVEFEICGRFVPVFGLAKTIGDCLRHRGQIGYPAAISAFNDAVRLRLTTSKEVAQMEGLCYGWDRSELRRF